MYNTDPTLYGATLPQREFPVMPQFGQQFPWTGYNRYQPFMHGFGGQYLPQHFGYFPQWNVPQNFGFYPQFGFGQQYTPMGFNPYIQGGFPSTFPRQMPY